MDLIITRFLGVRGELASLRGLKLRMALRIRFEVVGRVRMRMERQLRVASTTKASLRNFECQQGKVIFHLASMVFLPALLQDSQHAIQ